VPYPGFPGPKVAGSVNGATAAALPTSATSTPPVDPPDDELSGEGAG
jgi:hypothetical protein